MRRLLYVPLLHDPFTDMGEGFAKSARMFNLPLEGIAACGRRYISMAEKKLSRYEIDKVYMDTNCKGEMRSREYFDSISNAGSPTGVLIQKLIDRGARPMKTESRPMIRKASGMMNAVTEDFKRAMKLKQEKDVEGLKVLVKAIKRRVGTVIKYNEERDAYVARRIDTTLRDGEVATLFMGGDHEIRFPRSITVEYVIDRKKMNAYTDMKFFGGIRKTVHEIYGAA